MQRSGAGRPAACDLIRGHKAVDLFPRIKSQAAGRPAPLRCMCVFTLKRVALVISKNYMRVSNINPSLHVQSALIRH